MVKKVFRGFFSNLVYIPILIGMPMFQIFVISSIFNEFEPVAVNNLSNQLVEILIIKEAAPITMLQGFSATMIVMFTMLTGIILAITEISEREEKTISRIFSTPVKKSQYVIGCLIGQFIILGLCSSTLILLTSIVFDIHWGSSILGIIILTMAVIFVSLSMGMLFSGAFNNSKIASGAMSFIIVVMTFLSGGLTMSDGFGKLSRFTINWWANQGYISLMEGNTISDLQNPLIVLILLGIGFSIAATVVYRREGING